MQWIYLLNIYINIAYNVEIEACNVFYLLNI